MATEAPQKPVAAAPADAEKTTKKPEPREYRIMSAAVELDLTDAVGLIEKLRSIAGGEDVDTLSVQSILGSGKGLNPKAGITALAQTTELSGDYEVIAETSVTLFKNVRTQQVREVSIA